MTLLLQITLVSFCIFAALGFAHAAKRRRRRMYPPADPFASPFGEVVHIDPRSAGAAALRRPEAGGGSSRVSPAAAARDFNDYAEDDCPRCGVTESSCTCSHLEPSKRWPR